LNSIQSGIADSPLLGATLNFLSVTVSLSLEVGIRTNHDSSQQRHLQASQRIATLRDVWDAAVVFASRQQDDVGVLGQHGRLCNEQQRRRIDDDEVESGFQQVDQRTSADSFCSTD
jgi:hypothetical protein